MTLAELLEKSREYPQNVEVRAAIVDDEYNCYAPTLEAVDVFFDRDNTDQVHILLKKTR